MSGHIRGTNRHRFIYLIRHGDYQSSDEHFGGLLTPRGRQQAELLAGEMSKIPVDAIYSSTMHRAFQTAGILRDRSFPRLSIQRTPWLNERIFRNHRDYDVDPEAEQMLGKLTNRFFGRSRCERHDVLVCHGNVIRALVTRVLDAPVESWTNAAIAHCSITQLVCLGSGGERLISYNERGHLPFRLRLVGSGNE